MRKKIYSIISFLIILGSSSFLIRYLLISKKLNIINNIYFNFPGIIKLHKDCPNIDMLLNEKLDSTFSVTVIDEKGFIIGSHNSNKKRIPASNLKLFSSAYVLSKYKFSNNLKTSLLKTRGNDYYLVGQGDPDLSYSDIFKLLSNININQEININVVEIDPKLYWPEGWTYEDKLYTYGAPISTLAIESNQNKFDSKRNLIKAIDKYMNSKFPNSNIKINSLDSKELFYIKYIKEIDNITSNPIIALLTLSNSESHNFTAESLFKNASNTWNKNNYFKLKYWLKNKGLPVKDTYFADASGLSRNNLVTTELIALFLNKMRYSSEFKKYQSTLSLLGVRGTLANRNQNSELAGKFFGKTGTLSNVFALSGYLYRNKNPIIISIIQNSENLEKSKAFKILSDIYNLKSCS